MHPEAEGTNEEPLLQHDDFINQRDELSDGDEVIHSMYTALFAHVAPPCNCTMQKHVVLEICS